MGHKAARYNKKEKIFENSSVDRRQLTCWTVVTYSEIVCNFILKNNKAYLNRMIVD